MRLPLFLFFLLSCFLWPLQAVNAAVVVNTTADIDDGDTSSVANLQANPGADGKISLGEAILATNNDVSENVIHFDAAVFPENSPGVIVVMNNNLPGITGANTVVDATDRGVILDGSSSSLVNVGLQVSAANFLIRGLRIQSFPFGIRVGGSLNTGFGVIENNVIIGTSTGGFSGISVSSNDIQGTVIRGNFVGTDQSGADFGFITGVESGTENVIIGGLNASDANHIAFNDTGISLSAVATAQVMGNFIGTNSLGDNWGNGVGIQISTNLDPKTIMIGSTSAPNVIGFSSSAQILFANAGGPFTSPGNVDCVVQANFIGTDDQFRNLGVGGQGIVIEDVIGGHILLGGSQIGEGNVIAHASQALFLNGFAQSEFVDLDVQGNYFGTNDQGTDLGNDTHVVLDYNGNPNVLFGGVGDGFGNILGFAKNQSILVKSSHTGIFDFQGNYFGTDPQERNLGGTPTHVEFEPSASQSLQAGPIPEIPMGGNIFAFATAQAVLVTESTISARGNFFGTNPNGADLGNEVGIRVIGPAPAQFYGELDPAVSNALPNIFAHNKSHAIVVSGSGADQIQFRGNSIHSNGLGAILLENGANEGVLPPTLISVTVPNGLITGSGAVPNGVIDVYSNQLGEDQARQWEGSGTADANGNFSFSINSLPLDSNITLTQTTPLQSTSAVSNTVFYGTIAKFEVNTVADVSDGDTSSEAAILANPGLDGKISLREAIEVVNNDPTSSRIEFDPTVFLESAPATITATSFLPVITGPNSVVDGTGAGVIIKRAAGLSGFEAGLELSAENFEVRKLRIQGFFNNLRVSGSGHGLVINNIVGRDIISSSVGISVNSNSPNPTFIKGNHIGTDQFWSDIGGDNGIAVSGGKAVIGGLNPSDRNYIVFNFNGIDLRSGEAQVLGNYIGTNEQGDNLANNVGIEIDSPDLINIGGSTPEAANVFGYSLDCHISIFQFLSTFNAGSAQCIIQGNFIGTDSQGRNLAGGDGIFVRDISEGFVMIGGSAPGEGNVIAHCPQGIRLSNAQTINDFVSTTIQGNYLGTNSQGANLANATDISLNFESQSQNQGVIVGGNTPEAANIFAFATHESVFIEDTHSGLATFQGNFFGTDSQNNNLGGTPNHIRFEDGNISDEDITIGGEGPGEGNVFAFASGDALFLTGAPRMSVVGNFIGTNSNGDPMGNNQGVRIVGPAFKQRIGSIDPALSNLGANVIVFNTQAGITLSGSDANQAQFRGNSIHSNGTGGIFVEGGANGGVQAPILNAATESNFSGQGAVAGAFIDFYRNNPGENQAREYLGSAVADGNGIFSFIPPAGVVNAGDQVTAQQTDGENSSALSNAIEVITGELTIDAQQTNLVDSGSVLQISGTTTPGALVSLIVDGQVIATMIADANGNFSFDIVIPLGALSVTVSSESGGETVETTLNLQYSGHAQVFDLENHYRTQGFVRELDSDKLALALFDFSTIQPIDGEDYELNAHDFANNITQVTQGSDPSFTVPHNEMNESTQFGARKGVKYDALGRMIEYTQNVNGRRVITYLTWNPRDQLTLVEKSFDLGQTRVPRANYQYLPIDFRTRKKVFNKNGQQTLAENYYGPNGMICEIYQVNNSDEENSQPTQEFIYEGVDRPLAVFTNADFKMQTGALNGREVYFYQCNPKGDVYSLTDRRGREMETYRYSLYGEISILSTPLTITGFSGEMVPVGQSQFGNPFAFGGAYYDPETKNHFMRARYFDTFFKRFLTRDPAEDDVLGNLYAFVGNNPGTYRDPLGLASEEDLNELKTMIQNIENAKNRQDYDAYLKGLADSQIKINEIRDAAWFGEFLWTDDEFDALVEQQGGYGAFPFWSQGREDISKSAGSFKSYYEALGASSEIIDNAIGNLDTLETTAYVIIITDGVIGVVTGTALIKSGIKYVVGRGVYSSTGQFITRGGKPILIRGRKVEPHVIERAVQRGISPADILKTLDEGVPVNNINQVTGYESIIRTVDKVVVATNKADDTLKTVIPKTSPKF